MKLKIIIVVFITNLAFGQKVCNEFYNKKFTKCELVADIEFIKEKILNAHINPFTEISKEEFEKSIIQVENSLEEGMTQKDFYFLAKPIFVKLNDEHSALNDFCMTDSIKNSLTFFPLRFKYENQKVILTENYSGKSIANGDELLSINEFSIQSIIDGCSNQVFGVSEERKTIAIEKLWFYLSKFCFFITDDFNLKFKSGKATLIKGQNWEVLSKNIQKTKKTDTDISILKYEKIKNFGYLTINTFNDKELKYDKWELKIDSVFSKIKKDKVQKLIIDVSNNSGGNSEIGNLLIDYFSDKKYKDYGGKWKKSKEYSDLMKNNNSEYAPYEKLQNGEILPFVSDENKPLKNKNRFNGKTYVLVGENTFSSAMMFAVMVLDNKLATVIGKTPSKGHPNHFGELIGFTTPNTDLYFRFGVKEWIRPSGKTEHNKLIPNIAIDLYNMSKEDIIELLK
ncbi:hypothetical protein FPKKA176_contig00010-0001 [Flavobacterium psychrophilum]|uniref:S41 family peptidase n=1 Tax=Flavobacterium psychrophilum TaxID=96345 RepID=UPI0011511B41|nr:S41 family peptidase [Flavobacterium psychrophilum]GEJ38193.1 hypothetical protein FPN184_contig00067-0016 [Flavobacterium psychrophilum]GEJ48472.1 hypothetical protein FPKKA176_contig00010-0001 [Flavobacterium psychrophilum]